MGMGSLTLACALLLAHAEPEPQTNYINSTRMKIPITIDPEKRNELTEIILFYSVDAGKSWNQVGLAAKPDQKEFPFTATGDGQYWFTIQTVDKNKVKTPADVYKAPVGQKIIVDTVKPLVKLRAERKGDEIVTSWEVTEEHPNAVTFVLEYHLKEMPSVVWTPVAAIPGAVGNATIRPAPPGEFQVRLRVKDMAENEGSDVVEIAAAPVIPPTPPVPTPPAPTPLAVTPPAPGSVAPPITQASVAIGNVPASMAEGNPPSMIPSAVAPLRGALPLKQLVNRAEVKLDFDVTNIGPSGFGTVEVYVTTDEGSHWTQLPPDPSTIQMPEMRGLGQARGNVLVRLPDDGKVFGFYLVVRSRAGMGKDRPSSGTAPQIRLERDTLAPTASLKSADPDPTRRDTLILKWEAKDLNLSDRPITLQWSPKPDGPWDFIGGPELPNTGSYSWQVPPAAAAATSVFLKLTVHDGAGNVTVAETKDPVVVDMNIPEVAGVSISPAH